MKRFRDFVANEKGQDLVEYAFLAGLIALVAVVVLTELAAILFT